MPYHQQPDDGTRNSQSPEEAPANNENAINQHQQPDAPVTVTLQETEDEELPDAEKMVQESYPEALTESPEIIDEDEDDYSEPANNENAIVPLEKPVETSVDFPEILVRGAPEQSPETKRILEAMAEQSKNNLRDNTTAQ